MKRTLELPPMRYGAARFAYVRWSAPNGCGFNRSMQHTDYCASGATDIPERAGPGGARRTQLDQSFTGTRMEACCMRQRKMVRETSTRHHGNSRAPAMPVLAVTALRDQTSLTTAAIGCAELAHAAVTPPPIAIAGWVRHRCPGSMAD